MCRHDAVDNMIGQSLRLLEDYPQHYGLHYLLTMGYLLRGEAAQVLRSARAMVDFGVGSYGIAEEETCERLMAFLETAMAASSSPKVSTRWCSCWHRSSESPSKRFWRRWASSRRFA